MMLVRKWLTKTGHKRSKVIGHNTLQPANPLVAQNVTPTLTGFGGVLLHVDSNTAGESFTIELTQRDIDAINSTLGLSVSQRVTTKIA